MSTYTTELRLVCESYCNADEQAESTKVNAIIDQVWEKLFDFNFPIFEESYRKHLCSKIIRHFWMREIGFETVGLFKFKLENKLNEIMPYYNQLYLSERMEFDPLANTNYTREGNRKNEANGNTNGTSKNIDKYSETPQSGLDDVETGRYLTTADIVDNTFSNRDNSNANEDYNETIKGIIGVNGSKLLQEFRKTMLNIDMQIIDELESLFIQLW